MLDAQRDIIFSIRATDQTGQVFQQVKKQVEDLGRASTASTSSTLDRLAAQVKADARDAAKSGENALARVLSSPEGISGYITNRLGVGLAATAIDVGGRLTANATGNIVNARNRMAAGEIDGMGLFNEVMGNAPIIGGAWQTGRNLRELITGEQMRDAMRQRFDAIDDATNKGMRDAMRYFQDARGSSQKRSESSRIEADIAGMWRDPIQQQRAQIDESLRRAQSSVQDDIKRQLDQARARRDDQSKEFDNKASEIDKQLEGMGYGGMGRSEIEAYIKKYEGARQVGDDTLTNMPADGRLQDAREALRLFDEAANMRSQRRSVNEAFKETSKSLMGADGQGGELSSRLADEQRKYNEEIAKLDQQLADKRKQIITDSARQMTDAQTAEQASRLRLAGDFYNADLTELRRNTAAKKEEIGKAAQETIKLLQQLGMAPGFEKQINASARQQQAAVDAAGQVASQELARRERDRKAGEASGVLGLQGQLVGAAGRVIGYDSPELRRANYMLNVAQMQQGLKSQLERLSDNPANAALVRSLSGDASEVLKSMLDPDTIKRMTTPRQGPLRFAGTELLPSSYQGLAASTSLAETKANESLAEAKKQTETQKKMEGLLTRMATALERQTSDTILPANLGGS